MAASIVDVIAEVIPASASELRRLIEAFTQRQKATDYAQLVAVAPLHFMSMAVFEDRHFDPLLVFENNFEGDPDLYWTALEAAMGPELRAILACTKPAADPLWANLFVDGAKGRLAPFLRAHGVKPSAAHVGATGIGRDRVRREQALFQAIGQQIDANAARYAAMSAQAIHADLRPWAREKFPWLARREPRRTPQEWAAVILAAFAGIAVPVLVMLYWALGWSGHVPTAHIVFRLLALAAVMAVAVAWLRHLETTDFTQDEPKPDPAKLRRFAEDEDQIVQNHLASIVLVKPGVLRMVAIRLALWVLKLGVPLTCADGYLGSMRTIHFAHWTLVGNGGRLLFLSNFDGSWQSYLDDFVDKAHGGLTLAWSNCVGFPRTKFLMGDGATHGRQFKAWARQSQTPSLLWYSAYTDLTVNQIVRQADIADGLRRDRLTEQEAATWAAKL